MLNAGAPIKVAGDLIDGYTLVPGLSLWYLYDYACPNSTQPGSCRLEGTPEDLAARCAADAACQVMSFFPAGRDYLGGRRLWV